MPHRPHDGQAEKREIKRNQGKLPCSEDDNLYEIIDAANQQQEHEQDEQVKDEK